MSRFYQQLATLTPEQRALFEKKLAQKGLKSPTANTIPRRVRQEKIEQTADESDTAPLSFAQQRLWFVQQLAPDNTAYNVASVLELTGMLNIPALEQSLNTLVERHEILRTCFVQASQLESQPEGQSEIQSEKNSEPNSRQPMQVIYPAEHINLPVEDLRRSNDPTAAAKQKIDTLTQTPFDLTQPLFKTALFQTADDRHFLVLSTHHIISDRWSVMVFLREMTVLYRAFSTGRLSPLPPLPIQYADWAIWQRQQLQGETLKQQTDYWTAQLAGELPVLDLPFDRPYGAEATYSGGQYPLTLSPELTSQLKALSGESQVTLFTLLLTALKVLLHRYTGSEDIVIGSDIANRNRTETESLIGLLVNTLVFRSDLSNNPRFCDLLAQVRETVLSGLAHKDLPFEKLVEIINPERNLNQMMPLFQVKLDLQQVDVKPMQLDGLTIRRYPLAESQAKYELRFNLQDTPQGLSGQIEYNCDLFDEDTIIRISKHFQRLLIGIVENSTTTVSQLSLLDEQELRTLLIDWNQTHRDYPQSQCIHHLFEAQVEKTPDAIALIDSTHPAKKLPHRPHPKSLSLRERDFRSGSLLPSGEGLGMRARKAQLSDTLSKHTSLSKTQTSLTYKALNERANQIAHYLRAAGLSAGQQIGICLPRSWKMIASLLAVLKLGAAYVPLDPNYPAERLKFIAQDADLSALLIDSSGVNFSTEKSLIIDVDSALEEASRNVENTCNLNQSIALDQLAYIIYTSGSTGRPKGVAIRHAGTVSLLHWAQEQYSSVELSGVLAATSICFDLSIFEIFAPLSWGGTAILVENAIALPHLPKITPITLINTVPSVLNQLLNIGALPASVQTVNLAGEAFPPALLKRLRTISHIQKIYNLYGPSEDTTYSTCAPLHNANSTSHRVPIGKPIANTQAYVLDRYQQPVPIGISGELYLGGQGLAQGYLNRPTLTTDCFIPNPLQTSLGLPSERPNTFPRQQSALPLPPYPPTLYKTGDLARYRPDGSLEFLGRLDHQVKIRGFRIETGEIEAALRELDAVKDAVVIARRDADNDAHKQLVAYVVSKKTEATDAITTTLRHSLEQRLPAYLVPTQWVTLNALPHLPNGKINRKALPEPNVQSSAAYTAPNSALQQKLTNIWQAVLKQSQPIGIHDNFFELGGHSLLAIEIVAQVEATLQKQLPLKAIFRFPTIAGLAAQLEQSNSASASERERYQPRQQTNPDETSRYQPFPLTDIQRAYWVGRSQAFELGNIGTHGYREIDLRGLSVQQIEQALNTLIERHDMLRGVVNSDGQQQIFPDVEYYTITTTHLKAETAEAQLSEMRDRLSHQVFTPKDWPLFHIEAAHLPDNSTRFFVSFDVLIGDAWSFQLLGKEMVQLIRGQQLNPLTLSFRDYVMAEQAFQSTAAYQRSLNYWQNRLETLPPAPELPLAKSPRHVKTPKFERRSGRLFPQQWSKIKQRAHRAGLTPSGVVLAAFSEVLATWSKQKCFTLNLTLFNRLPLHPEVNSIVGDFTSSMLLAVDKRGKESFTQRAQRLQAQLWDDLEHRAVSGVRVVRELANMQNRGTAALMPVVFTSTLNQTIPAAQPQYWSTETVFSVSQTSQVYLDHQVSEIDGELVFNWDAIADIFPPDVLNQMFAAYRQLLHQLADEETTWQRTPQLAPTDYLTNFNQTKTDFPQADCLLHELFFQQASKCPEHPAVITPDATLTYRALAQQSIKLANKLRKIGLQPNQLVAVSMRKGWQQVVAVLGILSAGGAYVPIDPDMPSERRAHLVAEANADIVLITEDVSIDWPAGLTQICVDAVSQLNKTTASNADSIDEIKRLQQPSDLAYVIYTSGSTGTPKGVMIDHRSVVNTLLDMNERFGVETCDRILGLSSLSFDLSVYDIFGTLAAGATLVLPAAEQAQNPTHWRSLLTQHKITLWNSVPALMHLLVTELKSANAADLPASLRLVLLSGDWIPLTLPEQIQQHFSAAKTISLGGATEASIWSIYYPIEPVAADWCSIPYGRPLANQEWYVLDENRTSCPPWVTGELYIGGTGIAKGYWNQAELTEQRFVPASGSLPALYRTGDLGRYLPSGNLEFLGREDFQVKINGYRIELGEVERALAQYPAIETAVVEAVGSPAELVAYIVPKRLSEQAEDQALSQPLAKLDFKQKQLGIRHIQDNDKIVHLPPVSNENEDFLRRQSHRQFLDQPVELSDFSTLLSSLSSHTLNNAPLPKYRYASAGSLYPIQTYIHIKENRIFGLAAGWYYYHPSNHQLVKVTSPSDIECIPSATRHTKPEVNPLLGGVSAGRGGSTTSASDRTPSSDQSHSSENLYGPNLSLHQASAFSLFLVAEMDAIEPIYKEKSQDFALIETGYMGQLLMEQAPNLNLGLCPIGGFAPQALQEQLGLSEQQIPLHALIGGAIDPQWNEQWMATVQPSRRSIVETLKQHLAKKLPAYMVPMRYQILEQLPLTANGKVDRRALPQPDMASTIQYVAPTNSAEETVVQLWKTLLGAEKIGIHDNFFEAGGNSLIAMQLLSQLQNTFDVELTIAQLFGSLTPEKQAQLVFNSAADRLEQNQRNRQSAATDDEDDNTFDIDHLSDEAVDDLLQQLMGEDTQLTNRLVEEMSSEEVSNNSQEVNS